MNSENKTHHQSDWERCVICGNSVEPGNGAMRINHQGNTVNLCNPRCLRTFEQEPDPYLARLAKRMRELPQDFFAQRLPVLWAMHLIVRCRRLAPGQNKPEKCPKCAMKLVERR